VECFSYNNPSNKKLVEFFVFKFQKVVQHKQQVMWKSLNI